MRLFRHCAKGQLNHAAWKLAYAQAVGRFRYPRTLSTRLAGCKFNFVDRIDIDIHDAAWVRAGRIADNRTKEKVPVVHGMESHGVGRVVPIGAAAVQQDDIRRLGEQVLAFRAKGSLVAGGRRVLADENANAPIGELVDFPGCNRRRNGLADVGCNANP